MIRAFQMQFATRRGGDDIREKCFKALSEAIADCEDVEMFGFHNHRPSVHEL